MNKSLLFLTICISALMVSCNKAEIEDSSCGVGVLSVDMTIDAPVTKAALSDEELKSSAKVNIYRDKKGLVRSYTMASMPSPVYLEAGSFSYRVDVEAGEAAKVDPAKASWEQKSYKGSELFTITANQVTNIKVEATVSNAVTKITFDPTVAENFVQGYTFTIGLDTADPATQLVYGAENSGAEGYFIIDGIKKPSFTWNFSGTLTKDGSQFTKTGTIPDLKAGRLYKMNLVYTVKDGDLGFTLFEDDSYSDVFNERIEFDPVTTGLVKSRMKEFWATKATFYALVDQSENEGKSVQFAYKSGDGDWGYVDGKYVDNSEYNYTAKVTGLSPSTEYTYKLIVGGTDAGDNLKFTTEDAPNLPNAGFEHYSEVSGHSGVYKFYNPSCTCMDAESHKKFWASGNGDEESQGSIFPADYAVITSIDKTYKKEGECSVVAQSCKPSLANVLAAGNLFTGQFISASLGGNGGQSGIVNFGRKWTSRPSALKIWFRYNTGQLTHIGSNLPAEAAGLSEKDYDRAQIKVAIGTWKSGSRSKGGYGGSIESPVQVSTSDPTTFVDFYTDPSTIANGDVIIYHDGYLINGPIVGSQKVTFDTSVTDGLEITIPLNYREEKLETEPTHIIISCAASQYGDYFTGSTQSKLWLDAFELIYE